MLGQVRMRGLSAVMCMIPLLAGCEASYTSPGFVYEDAVGRPGISDERVAGAVGSQVGGQAGRQVARLLSGGDPIAAAVGGWVGSQMGGEMGRDLATRIPDKDMKADFDQEKGSSAELHIDLEAFRPEGENRSYAGRTPSSFLLILGDSILDIDSTKDNENVNLDTCLLPGNYCLFISLLSRICGRVPVRVAAQEHDRWRFRPLSTPDSRRLF